MTQSPSVTVVIPTYQRNELLREALESIASQTYDGPLEAIVVDSNEKPAAKPVVQEFEFTDYHRQVDYFSRHDAGTHNAAMSRDIGVYHAAGEFLHFLDDDDELVANALEMKMAAVQSASGVRGAYNAIETPSGSVKSIPADVQGSEIGYILQTLQSPAPASTLLVERDVLTSSLPQRWMTHTDFGTLIEILLRTNLTYVDRPLTVRKQSGGAGYSRETQIKRLKTARQYAGLRSKILDSEQQATANATYNRIRNMISIPEFFDGYPSNKGNQG